MTTSDMLIPRLTDIIDRALDSRASAERLNDQASYDQLTRLICALYDSPRMCWQLGTLVVTSPSGNTYHVTNAGCDCLNGKRSSKRQCWHVALHGVLLDMLDTLAESADQDSDPPGPNPEDTEGDKTPPDRPRAVAPRIVACRSLVWAHL